VQIAHVFLNPVTTRKFDPNTKKTRKQEKHAFGVGPPKRNKYLDTKSRKIGNFADAEPIQGV
jgi:hypothetical protein